MSSLDEQYRAQAALCRELAANARMEDAAAEFLNIANLWLSMAAEGKGRAEFGARVMAEHGEAGIP